MSTDYQHIRRDYTKGILSKQNLPDSPITAFRYWLDEALEANIPDANATVLSTVNEAHRPSSRVVLIKQIQDNGLVFFTNYLSRKAGDIMDNPYACMNIFWQDLERQIRIEGRIEKVSEQLSDAYFLARPRESRIGAICSPQSKEIKDRSALEEMRMKVMEELQGKEALRPSHWGGYILVPDYFEFWQGGAHRLHDRITYQKEGENWVKKRIAP